MALQELGFTLDEVVDALTAHDQGGATCDSERWRLAVDRLATKVCRVEMSPDRLRGALPARCREDRIEPPKTTRIERVLGAAEAMFERNFTATTVERLSLGSVGKLEELIVAEAAPAGAPAGAPVVAGGDASERGRADSGRQWRPARFSLGERPLISPTCCGSGRCVMSLPSLGGCQGSREIPAARVVDLGVQSDHEGVQVRG
ncbi:hypothetical protein [Nonomuraea lactucae]|uniref:hypothetical protein n=1 Tax=Nonomuraea lactucae TaxID=2249762 RepID=UPI000DE511D2|nr:hypothetical protein [Nonomuraea lactucae]